jgi:hypothetical protein
VNGISSLDQCSGDIGGLAGLSGLKTVREQLAARIAVQAEDDVIIVAAVLRWEQPPARED